MTDNRYEEEIYLEKIYSQNDEMDVLELIENLKNSKVNENLEIANCSMNSDSYQEQKGNYLNEENLFEDEEAEEEEFVKGNVLSEENLFEDEDEDDFVYIRLAKSKSESRKTKSSGNNQKSENNNTHKCNSKNSKTQTECNISIITKIQSKCKSLIYFKDYLFLQVETFLQCLSKSFFNQTFKAGGLYDFLKFLSYFYFAEISKKIKFTEDLRKVLQTKKYYHMFSLDKNFTEEIFVIEDLKNYFNKRKLLFSSYSCNKISFYLEILKNRFGYNKTFIMDFKAKNKLEKYFLTNFFTNINIIPENININNLTLLNRDLEFLETKLLFRFYEVSDEFLKNLNVVTSEMLLTYTVAGTKRNVSTMLFLKKKNILTSENALEDFDYFKHYLGDYKDIYFPEMDNPVNAHSIKALFFNLVENCEDVAEQLSDKIYEEIKYLKQLPKYKDIQSITLNEMVLYIYTMREPCKDCEQILQLSWELLCREICLFIQKRIIRKSDEQIKVIRSPLLNSIKKIISYTFPSDGKEVCEIKNNIKNPEIIDNHIHFYKLEPPVDKKEKEFLTRRYNIDIGKNKFNGYNNQLFVPETFTFFLSMPSFKKNMEEDLGFVWLIKNYEENENKFKKLYKKYIEPENDPIINESNFENLKYSLYDTIKFLFDQSKRYRKEYEIFIKNAELINLINSDSRETASKKITRFFKSIQKKLPIDNFQRLRYKFDNNWFSHGDKKYITDVASKILKLDKHKLIRNYLSHLLTKLPDNSNLNNSLKGILKLNPIDENSIENFINENHKDFIEFINNNFYVNCHVVYDESDFDTPIKDENHEQRLILMKTSGKKFSFMLGKNINNDYLLPVKIISLVKNDTGRNIDQCLELVNNFNTSYINSALQVLMTINTVTSSILTIKISDDIKQNKKFFLLNELYCLFKANGKNFKRYDPIGFLDFAPKNINNYNEDNPVEFILTILKDIENEFYSKINNPPELSQSEINPLYKLIEYNNNFLTFINENKIEEIEYDDKLYENLQEKLLNVKSFKFGIMDGYEFTELKSVEDLKNSISMNLKIFCLGTTTTSELWKLQLLIKNEEKMIIPFYLDGRENLDERINTYLNFYFNNSYSEEKICKRIEGKDKKVTITCDSFGYRTKAKENLLEQIKKFKQYPEYLLIKVHRFEGGFNLILNEELGKIISSSSSIKEIINSETEEKMTEEINKKEIEEAEAEKIVNTNMKSKKAINLSESLSGSKQSKASKNSEMVKNYYNRLFMGLGEELTLVEENTLTYKFISGIFLNDSDSNLDIGRQRRFFNIIRKDKTFVKVVDDSNSILTGTELEKCSNAYLLCYGLGK